MPQISILGFMADKVSDLDYAKLLNMDNDDLHPRGGLTVYVPSWGDTSAYKGVRKLLVKGFA